jgi:hypothetical protein
MREQLSHSGHENCSFFVRLFVFAVAMVSNFHSGAIHERNINFVLSFFGCFCSHSRATQKSFAEVLRE